MTIRNVIKRERIADERVPSPPASDGPARHAASVRLVELESGRYAIEHVCRCGEVALLEVVVDAPSPARETRA